MSTPKSKITLKTIAEQLGLTPTTVSRVLSGKGDQYRISQKAQRRVRELARKLNFSPNQIARGLRLSKTSTIGLILPDISNPYFATIARHVTAEARRREYSVLLCDSNEDTKYEIEAIQLIRSRNVDGLVLCPVGVSDEHLAELVESDQPVVLVDRYYPDLAIPSVTSDNLGGAREATEYLIRHGHKRIACLQGLQDSAPNRDRVLGYREALSHHDIPIDEELIVGDSFSQRSGYVATRLLHARTEFTAIFALSNQIALGSLQVISEAGLDIPNDVSIIAFDDSPYAPFLATPMTTVEQRNAEMGQIAAQLLFASFESRKSSQGLLLPTRLIERDSVANITQEHNSRGS
ncbi:MAG: LacI family DNA-binding transcriptional regulator [Planctomycetota bacterium]